MCFEEFGVCVCVAIKKNEHTKLLYVLNVRLTCSWMCWGVFGVSFAM